MKQQTNLQKNLGIFFGIVAIIGVFFVTIFWGQQSSNISTASLNQNSTPTSTTDNTPLQSIPSTTKQTPTPISTPVKNPVVTTTPPVIDVPKKSSPVYNNGTYSATGSYMSPGGEDQLGVTITLKSDIITSVSVTPSAGDRTSSRYQSKFISGYQSYVLGKNIANVYLTTISGSSLTPKGFNDALTQIKSQAKA